nr:VanZ family protein [uncultured Ruminococcus sp.]
MKTNSCSMRFRIIMFVLTASVIAFAFIHSSMPSVESAQESESVLDFVTVILKLFGIDSNLSDHIIRKLAHFTEYSVLGALLCSCAYSFDRIKPIKFVPYTVSIGLFTCFIDETIQLGVEGRSGQVSDMWIDFFGVLLGTAVMLVAFWIYRKIRKIN